MNSAALPATDRAKLAKLLALLGSTHPGERDAAGLAAHRLVQRCGMGWQQVLRPAPVHREPLQLEWRQTCANLMAHQGGLRPWERKFVADLPNFHRISSKQRYILVEIADRVLGRQHQ
jgi:hypothetical protein